MGTTTSTAAKAKAKSTSNVRHGPNDKNTVSGGRKTAGPSVGASKMSPIKGSNKGGVA